MTIQLRHKPYAHALQVTISDAALHETSRPTQGGAQASIVADLIAQKDLPGIFGLLGLVSDCATQEKLLADLPLLSWYPPDLSEGGIWREE